MAIAMIGLTILLVAMIITRYKLIKEMNTNQIGYLF